MRLSALGKHFATDLDLYALAAIRSTEHGVMQVGSNAGSPRLAASHKPLWRRRSRIFAAQPVWRYAAPRRVGRDMPVGLLLVGRTSEACPGS